MAGNPVDLRPQWARQIYDLAAEQWLPEDQGCVLVPMAPGLEGSREYIQIAPGLAALLGKVDYASDSSIAMETEQATYFHYRLSGTGTIQLGEAEPIVIAEHTGSLLSTTEGLSKLESFVAGEHERSVTLICAPEFLDDLYQPWTQQFAATLNAEATLPVPIPFPLDTEMVAAAQGLIECRLRDKLRAIYIRGRGLELLALSLASLSAIHATDSDLPQREIRKLTEVHDLLCTELAPSFTIQELAHRVGTNESKLMQGFKVLYGQTIFDFCQSRRMEHARHLLQETELSITEIAFEVGYEYPSNFTTAFKRQFGVTPKAARRGYNL